MGIVRITEWRLQCSPQEADARFRAAFSKLDLEPHGPPYSIHGTAQRSLRRNRWAARVSVTITSSPSLPTPNAICRVDMLGNKHSDVLADIVAAVGDDIIDDQGVAAAVARLGSTSRLFGRKEIRHLANLLDANERVVELGQGQYGSRQGLVVLTTARIFFLEKSFASESIEEFGLNSISSLSVSKKMTGETLQITGQGNKADIKGMMHGQADALSRAFRGLLNPTTPELSVPATPSPSAPPSPPPPSGSYDAADPIMQLGRLAELRDKGILSVDEFEAKKAEVLGRL